MATGVGQVGMHVLLASNGNHASMAVRYVVSSRVTSVEESMHPEVI